MISTRYIDPTTDFGFKRLFGREDSQEILKAFLLAVLKLPHPIAELTYLPTEQLPNIPDDRLGIYDVYCIDTSGRRFIVEMQRNRQSYFKERSLYYATFPIAQQVQKGDKDPPFALLPIYVIAVLNFAIDNDTQYIRRIQLTNVETGKVFYDKLTFVFIELSKFTGALDQLQDDIDRWIYLLRHMPSLQDIPAELAHAPFPQAFKIAEQAALSPEEHLRYEASLKRTLDERSIYFTGRQDEKVQIARGLLARNLDPQTISAVTGLSAEDLQRLQDDPGYTGT